MSALLQVENLTVEFTTDNGIVRAVDNVSILEANAELSLQLCGGICFTII